MGVAPPIVMPLELAPAPASAYFSAIAFSSEAGTRSREENASKRITMAHTASIAPNKTANRILVVAAVGLGMACAAAAMLWAHYGTAVFFEMIAAGIAMCF